MNSNFSAFNNSLLASSSKVIDLYWDANGDSLGVGGAGTISASAMNWRKNSIDEVLITWPSSSASYNKAIFSGVGGAVSTGSFSANKIYVLSSGYSFNSGSISLLGTNIEVNTEFDTNFSIPIYASNLIKTGSGTLNFAQGSVAVLDGQISHLNIQKGSVQISYGQLTNIMSSSIFIESNSKFSLSHYSPVTFPCNISGSGAVQKNAGGSTSTFTGNNSKFIGSYILNGGFGIVFSNDNAVGGDGVTLVFNTGINFSFASSGNTLSSKKTIITAVPQGVCILRGTAGNTNTIAAKITGVGSLSKTSSETHILTNINDYSGYTALSSPSNGSSVPESILRLAPESRIGGSPDSTVDFGNIWFTGATSNAVLEFNTASNLGPCSQIRFRNTGGTVGYGGCLRYTGSTNEVVSKTIQSDSNIGIRLSSNSTGSGSITYNGLFNQSNKSVYLEGTGSGILNSAFSGTGSLTKRDSGTWVLGGVNDYSGGTNIVGGILRIANSSACGTGTITVGSGATLDLNNLTIANNIVNNGGSIIN